MYQEEDLSFLKSITTWRELYVMLRGMTAGASIIYCELYGGLNVAINTQPGYIKACIIINNKDAPYCQRVLTLGHELGHTLQIEKGIFICRQIRGSEMAATKFILDIVDLTSIRLSKQAKERISKLLVYSRKED